MPCISIGIVLMKVENCVLGTDCFSIRRNQGTRTRCTYNNSKLPNSDKEIDKSGSEDHLIYFMEVICIVAAGGFRDNKFPKWLTIALGVQLN